MQAILTVNLQRGESPTCVECGHKVSSHVVLGDPVADGYATCFGCLGPTGSFRTPMVHALAVHVKKEYKCPAMVKANEDNKAKLQTQ